MKKRILSFASLFGLLALLMIFTQKVNADVDYDLDKVDATARVQRDGSLKMHYLIYYDFDSDARGVFYRQNLNKNQKLSNIQVKVNNKEITASKSEENNTYQLTRKSNSYRFKVFHRIMEGDYVKVEYSFRIKNAVTNYKDTAELNFKIIGDGWDEDLNSARATVIFPGKVPSLKAWAHGPLNGYTKVSPNSGKIVMTADNVPGDVGIEVHSIFSPEVTAANKNFVNENKKKKIEKQEAQLAIEANNRRRIKAVIYWVMLAISLFSGIAIIIYAIRVKKFGFHPKKFSEVGHNYEIPDVSPVAAQVLDEDEKPNAKAFTAYLMQLVGKHKIEIEKIKAGVLKHDAYKITLIDESILENDLLRFLFEKVGNGTSFDTHQLRKYKSRKLGKRFDKWSKHEYKLVEKRFFDKEAMEYQSKFKGISIMLIGLSSFLGILVIFLSSGMQMSSVFNVLKWCTILLNVLAFVIAIIAYKRISVYTEDGAIEADKVQGFKKMLKDIGNFKLKDVGDIILWEDILPYAVAFGLSKKVIKQMQIEFPEDEVDRIFVYAPLYVNGSFNNSFESSFESSFSSGISAGSSVSGGSGGFSGGSSGSFGGGSGGEAF